MNASWLDQMAPGHAPAAPGWWPPAIGWWLLLALLISVLVGALLWFHGTRRTLRRMALREVRMLQSSGADTASTAQALQNLMRRYAVQVYGTRMVGRLAGKAWLEFVVSHGGSTLAGEAGQSLLTAVYGRASFDERRAWFEGTAGFIKHAGGAGKP